MVNTGDDFDHLGFAISPDLDTVMYTLAGVNNPASGWGRAHETWNFMSALGALGGEAWFRLGDRDLAVHVLRTLALKRDATLSEITHALAKRFGIRHNILPMSNSAVRTRVLTSRGELAFRIISCGAGALRASQAFATAAAAKPVLRRSCRRSCVRTKCAPS